MKLEWLCDLWVSESDSVNHCYTKSSSDLLEEKRFGVYIFFFPLVGLLTFNLQLSSPIFSMDSKSDKPTTPTPQFPNIANLNVL